MFCCEVIANLLTRERFYTLRTYLHITNPATYEEDWGHPDFDKMCQTRPLLEKIGVVCKIVWNLGKFVTMDEMMVRYKGGYCPVRQYMPKKLVKWGLKLWYLANSSSKFISNFDVYCGKSRATLEESRSARGESNLPTRVVLDLTSDIHEKGHVVVMDNYFSSIELFNALEEKGTYATGTIRSNRIGLPHLLADTKQFNRNPQGTLDWSFHESRKIACTI